MSGPLYSQSAMPRAELHPSRGKWVEGERPGPLDQMISCLRTSAKGLGKLRNAATYSSLSEIICSLETRGRKSFSFLAVTAQRSVEHLCKAEPGKPCWGNGS